MAGCSLWTVPNQSTERLAEYQKARAELRRQRKRRGLTLQALADQIGYDMSRLAKIERGEIWVAPELQERIANALARDVDALFRGRGTYRCAADDYRDELMKKVGGCGSPTCLDGECTIRHGRCHNPGCSNMATVAPKSRPSVRWVLAQPTLYCSLACTHAAGRARRDELRQSGLHSAADVAAMVGRSPRDICNRYAGRVIEGRRIGRQVPGIAGPHGGHWFFTDEDVNVIRKRVGSSIHADPVVRAQWHVARHKDTRVAGRLAPELAAMRGRTVGRPVARPDMVRQVQELADKGLSQRAIGIRLGISRGSVQNALKKRAESGLKPPSKVD